MRISVVHAVGLTLLLAACPAWGQSLETLGDLPGGLAGSVAHGVSADGSVVVGLSRSEDGFEAFRWTASDGMVGLGDLPGGLLTSSGQAVSADGSVVVGYGHSEDGQEAFRWTEADGMVGLGDFDGGVFSSAAYGVSADGSVVVGRANDEDGQEAFRWTEATGLESIAAILKDAGVDLTGWDLRQANDVSADGTVIVGNGWKDGKDEAFIAKVPLPEADDDTGGDDGTGDDGTGDTGGDDAGGGTGGDEIDDEAGLTTPEDLARSLTAGTVPGQQSRQAMGFGLGQSLFAARHAASAVTPQRVQVASTEDRASWLPEPSKLSAYAVGSIGAGGAAGDDALGLNGTTGLVAEIAPGLHLGAGVVGARSDAETDFGGESDLTALGGSVIAAYEAPRGLRLYGSAFAARLDVETDRHYRNGAGIDSSRGETDGVGYGVAVRGGWEVPVAGKTALTPYAELQWSKTELDGYTEEGGAFPAAYSDQSTRLLTSRLGAEVAHRLTPALELQARAAWGHRIDGEAGRVTATTLGLTQTLNPALGDRDWAEGAVSAVWQVGERTTLLAEVAGRTGETAEPSVTGTLGLSVKF